MNIYKLVRIDFENLENSETDAISKKVLGHYKTLEGLQAKLESINQTGFYYGYNDQIYPQLTMEVIKVIG